MSKPWLKWSKQPIWLFFRVLASSEAAVGFICRKEDCEQHEAWQEWTSRNQPLEIIHNKKRQISSNCLWAITQNLHFWWCDDSIVSFLLQTVLVLLVVGANSRKVAWACSFWSMCYHTKCETKGENAFWWKVLNEFYFWVNFSFGGVCVPRNVGQSFHPFSLYTSWGCNGRILNSIHFLGSLLHHSWNSLLDLNPKFRIAIVQSL